MRRALILSIIGVFLLAIPASHSLWGKAHVPAHKTQFCHNGEVIEVGSAAARAHLAHGDSELPACDFANIFHKGESCDFDLNPRIPAAGTPGCPADGSRF